jgi:hypothetical protein
MFLDFENFRKATDGCDKLFEKWKYEFEHFREEARDMKNYRVSKTEFAIKVWFPFFILHEIYVLPLFLLLRIVECLCARRAFHSFGYSSYSSTARRARFIATAHRRSS